VKKAGRHRGGVAGGGEGRRWCGDSIRPFGHVNGGEIGVSRYDVAAFPLGGAVVLTRQPGGAVFSSKGAARRDML